MTIDQTAPLGPLETKHSRSQAYQNVKDGDAGEKLTSTHWHIWIALGLGWMLDGIVIALYALIVPYLLEDFSISLDSLTAVVTLTGFLSAFAAYFWPWLADRVGRRMAFIVNVALQRGLPRPDRRLGIVALLHHHLHDHADHDRRRVGRRVAADRGDLARQTSREDPQRRAFPLRLRRGDRRSRGHLHHRALRLALGVPRAGRHRTPRDLRAAPLSRVARVGASARPADRRGGEGKLVIAAKPRLSERIRGASIGQLFESGQGKRTFVALFVAATATMSWYTLGYWAPFFLKETHGWSTSEYSTWYIWWGVARGPRLLPDGVDR